MEKAIASLLILSGDENPDLFRTYCCELLLVMCRVESGDFVITDEVDQELRDIEQQYGLDLHRTWHTRLPRDLLTVGSDFARLVLSSR